jgi:hypothetical protein
MRWKFEEDSRWLTVEWRKFERCHIYHKKIFYLFKPNIITATTTMNDRFSQNGGKIDFGFLIMIGSGPQTFLAMYSNVGAKCYPAKKVMTEAFLL